jgi:OmpA-OmpF porin, OOP family
MHNEDKSHETDLSGHGYRLRLEKRRKIVKRTLTLWIMALLAIAAVSGYAQDRDNDGLADDLDRRPSVATYFNNTAPSRVNPIQRANDVDSDNDGVPDYLDNRPYVLEYPNVGQMLRWNPSQQPMGIDSDRDGLPDYLDNRPYVMEYYNFTGPERQNPLEQPESLDSDNDGVPDVLDNRPYVMEYPNFGPRMEKPRAERPVARVQDTDCDGVVDESDQCPETPAGVQVNDVGCPIDSDGDGVADYLDKCAETPVGVAVGADGCPRDGDSDGVPDSNDRQLDTPAGAPVDEFGVALDSDNDGVIDLYDKCAGTAAGVEVDDEGCPRLMKTGEKIILNVVFATNSADPDQKSKEILDGVAETMKQYPEIKVRIAGFTDDVGNETHNQRLSDRRARAVMDYLASRGVERGRMTSIGFGENPRYFIGDNSTEEGRQKNRRVEIESVE